MLVRVEDGLATKVSGNPEQPVTAGFLCGKVSNYLERVYSPERVLHPLVRTGAKGDAAFRRASWDEALELVARVWGARSSRTAASRSSRTATPVRRDSCRAT